MMTAYRLTLGNHAPAWIMELHRQEEMTPMLSEGLALSRKTLVVIGGAKGLSTEDYDRLERLFAETLCPFAEAHQLVIVDGGTDCGVMRLMGRARQQTQATFPLVGVVVKSMVYAPGDAPDHPDQAPLEANHTHFVMVPGQAWGDESSWISQIAKTISGGMASATLLINGGDIALYQDVPNSLSQQRPVLVMAESGRTADKIAAALAGDQDDKFLNELVKTGLIQAVRLSDNTTAIDQALNHLYS